MNKRVAIFIKTFIYCALIITLSSLLYFNEETVETLKLKYKLKYGKPSQKEDVLNLFMEKYPRTLVPDVIKAILDDTPLPRHDDTGWGTVHHQAATAMCNFARLIDGKTQRERGVDEYSFFNDGGRANLERRKEVYGNWKQWWKKYKKSRITYRPNQQ